MDEPSEDETPETILEKENNSEVTMDQRQSSSLLMFLPVQLFKGLKKVSKVVKDLQ